MNTLLLREVKKLAQGHTARPDSYPQNQARHPGRRMKGNTQSQAVQEQGGHLERADDIRVKALSLQLSE